MRDTLSNVVGLLGTLVWIAGIVIADGIWKLVAIVIPPYAFYVVVELALRRFGVI